MNKERISLLKQFIEEEPDNPFNIYALAMEYYDTIPEESLSILRKLLIDHPFYLPTYFKAAHIMWEDELWEEADKTFEKGIRIAEEQNDSKALLELKSAHQNFGFDRE
ncbi:MAG: tetratricopeptide repeat protein [Bacteroidota bacterium]